MILKITLNNLKSALIRLSLVIAAASAFLSPVLAISWRNQPFAGFLLEPTLVITDITGDTWNGFRAGLKHPQKVDRVAGSSVVDIDSFNNTIRSADVGQQISIITTYPEGNSRVFFGIQLQEYPRSDFVRIFWIPYIIGVVFLVSSIWIFKLKHNNPASRALTAFFSLVSVVCVFLFDLYTTHVGSMLWVSCMAFLGGIFFYLGFVFPDQYQWAEGKKILKILSFAISVSLAVWGVITLNDPNDPWSYIPNWLAIYRFIGAGIVFFFVKILISAFRVEDLLVRRQARAVLVGSMVGFTPLVAYFLAPLIGVEIPFEVNYMLPPLIAFPISITFAITRYRLFDVDDFVSRALAYGAVTIFLAGVFPGLTKFLQEIFFLFTQEKNEISVGISTFILAASVEPVKQYAKRFISNSETNKNKRTARIQELNEEIDSLTKILDTSRLAGELLEKTVSQFDLKGAAIFIKEEGSSVEKLTYGRWPAEISASFPICYRDHHMGNLFLGAKEQGLKLEEDEIQVIDRCADKLGEAYYISRKLLGKI